MLTEEQLDILPETLLPLFQYLEKEVIADIARRIQKTLTYTRTAELQALSMKGLGYSPARIRREVMKLLQADKEFKKIVAKNTLAYKKEIKERIECIVEAARAANNEIVATAGNMAWIDDLSVWRDAGKALGDNSFLSELVKTFADQTAGTFTNMTMTSGFKTLSGCEALQNAYTREMDKALIKLCSGTFSQEKIVKDTVHELAVSGLRSIDFASGYSMQLDTAVRLALRTGYHQLAGKVTDKNMEQTGENLVYVSKHWGARNTGTGHANHEQWQGKVYFIKEGKDYSEEARRIGQDRIMSLWYATGYSVDGSKENDPTGLNGYNCRHSHYPWFEGVSSLPKESPEPKPVEIDSKTYDYYAITQKMRAMERSVRALKREKEALKALGMDTTEISAKISRKTREYKEFCGQAGVKEKPSRLRYECGTTDLQNTEAWKAYKDLQEGMHSGIIKDTKYIDECETVEAVENLMKSKGWFRVTDIGGKTYDTNKALSLKNLDVRCAKDVYRVHEKFFERYPQLKGKLNSVAAIQLPNKTYAQCSFGLGHGGVNVNTNWFGDYERITKRFQSDVEKGYHPKGVGYESIVMHELGHAIDDYMTYTKHAAGLNGSKPKIISAYLRPKVLKSCGLNIADISTAVSVYATKNPQEWFAECFCEYMCSEDPRPIAKAFGEMLDQLLKGVE